MYELPTTLHINNQEFKIRNKGDFRVTLDCFSALNDRELDEQERVYAMLIIFFEDINDIYDIEKLGDLEKACKEIEKFFNCGQESVGLKTNYKVLDWDKDEQLITSAINNVAKTEIRSLPYLHWWTFMGYYLAIGECPLSNIVSIRHKIATGKKLEKYENTFRQENPQYFDIDYRSNQDKDLEDWFLKEVWNK